MSQRQLYVCCMIFTLLADQTFSDAPLSNTSKYESEVRREFERGGVSAVKALVVENLDVWSREGDVNIGVTGNSGVGKSSFINAIRGMSAEEEGAAEVGVIETTMTMKLYKHPQNNRLILWDLPGIGTPTFRHDRYIDRIQASNFDCFVIITSTRFTENDMWLANQFERLGKDFYFVRSKISQDIENDRKSHPNTHQTDQVLAQIRTNLVRNLLYELENSYNQNVYLIDNYETHKYDFKELSENLVVNALHNKKRSLKSSLRRLTDEIISSKKVELQKRIHKVAVASGIAGAVPIPGVDVAFDMTVLLEEIAHYRDAFGLNDDALSMYARSLGISLHSLKRTLNLESSLIEYSAPGILAYLTKTGLVYGTSYATANVMKYVLPIIGNIASAFVSFSATEVCLNSLLDLMTDDARKVNNFER